MTTTPAPAFNLVGAITDFEMGVLDVPDVVALFSHLVKTGLAWTLQGSYGRAAQSLINDGILAEDGEILVDVEDL